MIIRSYEAQALRTLGTLHGSLAALERDLSKDTVRDAMEAALRLTEAVGDLSGVLISMLDRIDGDIDLEDDCDLEDSFDREDDRASRYVPIYGVNQSRPVLGCRKITN